MAKIKVKNVDNEQMTIVGKVFKFHGHDWIVRNTRVTLEVTHVKSGRIAVDKFRDLRTRESEIVPSVMEAETALEDLVARFGEEKFLAGIERGMLDPMLVESLK